MRLLHLRRETIMTCFGGVSARLRNSRTSSYLTIGWNAHYSNEIESSDVHLMLVGDKEKSGRTSLCSEFVASVDCSEHL